MKIYTLEAEKAPKDLMLLIVFWAFVATPFLYGFSLVAPNFLYGAVEWIMGVSELVPWILVVFVPSASFYIFKYKLSKYSQIYIEEDKLTLKTKGTWGESREIKKEDIVQIKAYRTPPLNIKRNLFDNLHYWTMLPVALVLKNKEAIIYMTRGEVLNVIKETFPSAPRVQVGVFNRYTILLMVIGLSNIFSFINFFWYLEIYYSIIGVW